MCPYFEGGCVPILKVDVSLFLVLSSGAAATATGLGHLATGLEQLPRHLASGLERGPGDEQKGAGARAQKQWAFAVAIRNGHVHAPDNTRSWLCARSLRSGMCYVL
jgi:hypothetical protein